MSACTSSSKYDYHIYKPKVRYKPSAKALDKLNNRALGKPYIWAEERANRGFDCSGLTYYNFGTMGINIPRTANQQFHSGTPVAKNDLQKGDLVFFATKHGHPYYASHVGIYLGNGMFEHASSAKKHVIISSLNKPYYRHHYIGARRYYSFNSCPLPAQSNTIAYAQMQPQTTNSTQNIIQPANIQQSNIIANTTDQTANSKKYFISLGNFTTTPNDLILRLQLSGYPTKVNQKSDHVELSVGPFESANEAYSMLDLNRDLFGNSATVKDSL